MDVFLALSEPTRRSILELLAERGRMAASEIAKRFKISAPAISQHLKVLREAELVSMEKQAQQRIYELNSKKLEEVEVWVKKLENQWNDRFDALDKLLEEEKKKEAKKKNKNG